MPDTRDARPPEPPSTRTATEVDDQITLASTTPAPGRVVIAVGGEVDMLTSPQLRRSVLGQLAHPERVEVVVLDLDGVSFLGTSGLAVLIEAREVAHTAGVELRLVGTEQRVLRPLTIAGLVPLFDIHATLDGALAST